MTVFSRKEILVVGGRELSPLPFGNRGLVLKPLRVEAITESDIATACGILVAEPAGQYREIRALADKGAQKAFAMGLMIGIWPANPQARAQAELFRDGIPAASQPHSLPPNDGRRWIEIQDDLEVLAESLRVHDPGPHAGNPEIKSYDPDFNIPPEHALLLRRAFQDAGKLIVEDLAEGKTADGTYRVFVELKGRDRGPQPMPFVFKVAQTKKAVDADEWINPLYVERYNYRQWAEPFIPFHLRPGLLEERCVTTPFWSAIACHFVDGAVLLETVLQNRQGAGLLFSLFETTLRGLRAHTLQSEPEAEVIRTFILKRIDARRLSEDEVLAPRVTMAMGHGFTGTPDQLQAALADAAKGRKSRRGIYHGDLHLANIMVRQRDSIVIDFGSMGDFGPITADPAALEASIVFGTRPISSEKLQKEWRDYIDQLYRYPLIPPLPSAEHFQYAWINRAVRELRHVVFCCGASEPEMLLMLSASLLRFARFSPADYRDQAVQRISEERKAYALVIAQRVYHEALKALKTP